MNRVLDAKDRAPIGLLARNARQPLLAPAMALGLSRSATLERLRRFETRCGSATRNELLLTAGRK